MSRPGRRVGSAAMCGRYVAVSSPTILAERFGVDEVRVEVTEPSYNVTPRADVPAIAQGRGRDRDVATAHAGDGIRLTGAAQSL